MTEVPNTLRAIADMIEAGAATPEFVNITRQFTPSEAIDFEIGIRIFPYLKGYKPGHLGRDPRLESEVKS